MGAILLHVWWGWGLFWESRVVLGGARILSPHALTMRPELQRGSSQSKAGERSLRQAAHTWRVIYTHRHIHTHCTHLHLCTLRKINMYAPQIMHAWISSHTYDLTLRHNCTTCSAVASPRVKEWEFIMSGCKWLMPFSGTHRCLQTDKLTDRQMYSTHAE